MFRILGKDNITYKPLRFHTLLHCFNIPHIFSIADKNMKWIITY